MHDGRKVIDRRQFIAVAAGTFFERPNSIIITDNRYRKHHNFRANINNYIAVANIQIHGIIMMKSLELCISV